MPEDQAVPSGQAGDGWSATVDRFSGYAADYDTYRPQPPGDLVDFLAALPGKALDTVVDLGCGTGLSTRVWAGRARSVVGVDPSADMIARARVAAAAPNVTYHCRFGHDTGLPDRCADLITCGLSLHWMDPAPTAAEVGRLLRPGGAFGTYWEHWASPMAEVERAFRELERQVDELDGRLGASATLRRWPRRAQEKQLAGCGLFALTREIAFHHVAPLTADQLVRMVRTLGAVMVLVKHGLSDDQIGLTKFGEVAAAAFGGQAKPIYHTWGLWYGVAKS